MKEAPKVVQWRYGRGGKYQITVGITIAYRFGYGGEMDLSDWLILGGIILLVGFFSIWSGVAHIVKQLDEVNARLFLIDSVRKSVLEDRQSQREWKEEEAARRRARWRALFSWMNPNRN